MKAHNTNKDDLIKDIQKTSRRVKARVENIEKNTTLPQYGAESFRKFENRLKEKLSDKNLRDLSTKELQTIYRDISYLDQLKSTSVKGATQALNLYEPMKDKLNLLSKEKQREFDETYNKFIGEYRIADFYKYEFQDSIVDMMLTGADQEDILQVLRDTFSRTYEELGGDIYARGSSKTFLSNLGEFL